VTRSAATVRQIIYDNAGNILTDNKLGVVNSYTYNKRNRLDTATVGALPYAYGYTALEQLVTRQQTAGPSPFTTHFVHDVFGNIVAETAGGGATGATGTVREYIWLPETEIAPTLGSRTTVRLRWSMARPASSAGRTRAPASITWDLSSGSGKPCPSRSCCRLSRPDRNRQTAILPLLITAHAPQRQS
jgi:hypothetical protein